MKRSRTIFVLLAMVSLRTVNATTIQAHLDITPSHVLPGLPALFTISLSNRDDAPRSVRNFIRLRFTSAAPDVPLVQWGGHRDETVLGDGEGDIVLAASETRNFYIAPTAFLTSNEAFWDRRLTTPGSYEVHAEIGDDFAIITNAARLTVDQPTGNDLQVWNLMSQRSAAGWPVDRWVTDHDFLNQLPNSTYTNATIALRTPSDQLVSALPPAITKLSGPLRDDLRLLLIECLRAAADSSFNHGDVKASDALLLQALGEAEQLRRNGSTPYATSTAKQQIDEIAAITVAKHGALLSNDPYRPLVPLPPCKPKDGRLRFGYSNDNHWPIVIHVGPDNQFDPVPADRQQPTIFGPGKHVQSFDVSVLPDEVLKWTLDGTTLTYQAAALKPCSGESDN